MEQEQKQAIYNAVKEISNHMTIRDAALDSIKAVTDAVKEKYKYPTKKLKDLAKLYHEQNRDKVDAEVNELLDDYDTIVGE